MKCPECNNQLIVLELHDIEIDHCTACGGTWLDAGELEQLLSDSSGKDALLSTIVTVEDSHEKPIKCPICSKKAEKIAVGPEKNIILDRCRKNHGIWLNKGELESVLKLAQIGSDNPVMKHLMEIFNYEDKTSMKGE